MSILPAAVAGFVIGLRHATDADHVAAITTIVARERTVRSAAIQGAAWGVGHTVSLVLLGGAILAFGWVVPPHVGVALEGAVGLMLIVLGALALIVREKPSDPAGPAPRAHAHARPWRPFAVGSMHGVAGSAAAAVLGAAAMRETSWGVAYLVVFGLGALVGMTILTALMALPLGRLRFAHAKDWIRRASGVASLAVGVVLLVTMARDLA